MENVFEDPKTVYSVGAILLAAGQSRRMGAFKPLLPFGKQTVIDSCINYLLEGGAKPVVVVLGHRANIVKNHLQQSSVKFALNPDPTSEMGASIAAGVQELPESVAATVIALVDYPAIPPSVVRSLINAWSNGSRLVKPTLSGRGGHPVLVDLSLRDELLNLDPKLGLKALFNKYQEDVSRVEVDSPYIARDIDTWDDYRGLYTEIFGETAPGPENRNSNENAGRLI
jgi:molybdenum cofactor cytidylyltransferase